MNSIRENLSVYPRIYLRGWLAVLEDVVTHHFLFLCFLLVLNTTNKAMFPEDSASLLRPPVTSVCHICHDTETHSWSPRCINAVKPLNIAWPFTREWLLQKSCNVRFMLRQPHFTRGFHFSITPFSLRKRILLVSGVHQQSTHTKCALLGLPIYEGTF